jgi:hypothetical protein
MQPDPEIAVIVVLGSVKAKEYQRLRLKHFLQGRKVCIARMSDDLKGQLEYEYEKVFGEQPNPDDEYSELMKFVSDMFPGDVYEVLACESWWNRHESFEHLFSHYWKNHWPKLSHVTLVYDDGTYMYV